MKETWKPHSTFAHLKPSEVPDSKIFYAADQSYAPSNTKWWPSLFMQRRFSRLTLEIADVRVERLQDCSEADALAEGAEPCANGFWFDRSPQLAGTDARGAYYCLWDSINGGRPGCAWADNPWVWVVSFRRVEADALRGAA